MPKVTKPVPRAKRSRADVQQEFEAIRGDVESAKETADPKREEQRAIADAETRTAVSELSVEGVVRKVSGLSLEISKTLSDLSAKLTDEVERLGTVREAVDLERRELERLHKIDVGATALDQLVQEYRLQEERLEAEIAAKRASWEEEERNTERERKEQEEGLKKQRQRDIDEYEYKKTLERKRAQDKYDEDQRLVEKKNKEKQETLQKDWDRREAELSEREEELARLRKEAQDFPVRLQKESAQAAAQATKATEQRFDQQMTMLKKESESEQRLAALQVKTLEEAVGRQAAQIAALEKQLDGAKQQVQEIAVRAIDGASGAKALTHINQIAMEQAKTRSPQG